MKKSLVALAVLGAFTGIASAQSSVTLYGRIDQAVMLQDPGSKISATTGGAKGHSLTKLQEGLFGGSRLGFRGVEDLGEGFKAFFQLEAGVTPDSGSAGGTTTLNSGTSSFFNRGAYVGLRHNTYGEIRLGRQESLTRENAVKINDISADGQFSLTESLEKNGDAVGKGTRPLFQNFGTRVDNAIRYTTPVFGGLQASAIVGLSERTIVGGFKAANYRGLGLVYTAGPLALDVLYEDLSKGGAGTGSYNNTTTVGGSYDFGLAKVAAAYQHTNNLGSQLPTSANPSLPTTLTGYDVDAWNIGVAVPVNAFTFKAQYTGSSLDRTGGLSTLDQSKYGVSLEYAFSKRTTVYVAAIERSGDQSSYYSRQNEYAIGMAHTF